MCTWLSCSKAYSSIFFHKEFFITFRIDCNMRVTATWILIFQMMSQRKETCFYTFLKRNKFSFENIKFVSIVASELNYLYMTLIFRFICVEEFVLNFSCTMNFMRNYLLFIIHVFHSFTFSTRQVASLV